VQCNFSAYANSNTAGLRSTDCPAKHDSADWTPNSRAAVMVAAVWWAGNFGRCYMLAGGPARSHRRRRVAEPGGRRWMQGELCREMRLGDGHCMSTCHLPSQPGHCARGPHADARTIATETFYHTRRSRECRRPRGHRDHAPSAGALPVCRGA